MKKLYLSVIFSILLCLICTSCIKSPTESPSVNQEALTTEAHINLDDYFDYIEPIENIEDIISRSNYIVKAKFISEEDNSVSNFQTFRVEKNYYGETEDEIVVVDYFWNGKYIEGHSYFLFLSLSDVPLYPYPLYTTKLKSLVIDVNRLESNPEAISETKFFSVKIAEVEKKINDIINSGKMIAKDMPLNSSYVNSSNNLISVAEEAQAIIEVRVLSERNVNEFVSSYELDVVSILRHTVATVGVDFENGSTLLPPKLSTDTTYYLLLKCNEDGSHYRIFSRKFPVVETTEENKKLMGIVG